MLTRPSSDGLELVELMARIAAADKGAFAKIFGHFAPRIKGYLMRLGCDASTAEELAQDVMLAVWQHASGFDPARSSVPTWVFAIARNRRIDRLRQERRPEIDPEDPMLVPAMPANAEAELEMVQRDEQVRAALRALPREQAEVVYMAYFQDKGHSGIADERRLPLGTVKSRLRLGLGRLKRALDRRAGEDEA